MIATGFVKNGAKVYITSRSAEVCDKVSKELNRMGSGECISLPADLSDLDDLKRFVQLLSDKEDHIDVLVNNAGANWGAPIETFPDSGTSPLIHDI